MAAFSSQLHYPFLLDSIFSPNSTPNNKVSALVERGNGNGNIINNICNYFSHFNPPGILNLQQTSTVDAKFQENSCPDYSSKAGQSTDSSGVVDKLESGEQVSQKFNSMERKRKSKVNNISSSTFAQYQDPRESKSKRQKKSHGAIIKDEEQKSKADKKDRKEVPKEAPKGYIHVRARRGQATDSHSLAERVRREKISERMRILQELVPGCEQVTGKALILDQIINYVQSLQNQVEFLSMKLASVDPLLYDFGMDAFMVRPEGLNSLESPLPSLQQSNPNQSTAFADTTCINLASNSANNFSLLDTSAALFFQQGQRLVNAITQDTGNVLWDVDGQRQKLLNSSEFSHNLCPNFH